MDVQGINTHYDYVALAIIYVSTLLGMFIFKWLLSLFHYSKEASRVIAGTVTLLSCTLLYVTRSIWLAKLPADIHMGLIMQAVGTIWWLSLGYSVIHILEFFVWSGIFTQRGQLVVPKILTDLIRILIAVASGVFMLHYVYAQPITGVLATSGVLAIVIGYSAQSSLSHVFAGLTYRKSKSLFRPGPSAARSRWRLLAAMAATPAPSGCLPQPRAARPSAA